MIAATVININPFIKFDGYWLLTDITGVPSLHRSMRETWSYIVDTVRGVKRRKPDVLERHPFVVALFTAYWLGSVIFVLYLIHRLTMYLPMAVERLPTYLIGLWQMGYTLNLGWAFWKLAFATLLTCLTVYSLSIMLWRRLFPPVKRMVQFLRGIGGLSNVELVCLRRTRTYNSWHRNP
jgi:hypothetical protein